MTGAAVVADGGPAVSRLEPGTPVHSSKGRSLMTMVEPGL